MKPGEQVNASAIVIVNDITFLDVDGMWAIMVLRSYVSNLGFVILCFAEYIDFKYRNTVAIKVAVILSHSVKLAVLAINRSSRSATIGINSDGVFWMCDVVAC